MSRDLSLVKTLIFESRCSSFLFSQWRKKRKMFVSWWSRISESYMLSRHDGQTLYSSVKIRGCVDRTILEERRFFSASKQYGEEERKIYLTNGTVKTQIFPLIQKEKQMRARCLCTWATKRNIHDLQTYIYRDVCCSNRLILLHKPDSMTSFSYSLLGDT